MSTRRIAAMGLTVVVAIAVLMAFPSVRAAASDFLGLFRVKTFAPISVSPQQLAVLERLGEEGLEPGEFVVTQELGVGGARREHQEGRRGEHTKGRET